MDKNIKIQIESICFRNGLIQKKLKELFKLINKAMQRQNIIVVTHLNEENRAECYGNLKKACEAHKLVYNTIVQKKLPLIKDGLLIQRVPFN